ncbi:MAG: hypothetical protein WBC04_16140 [Candidatus Acidiferrales bacterium]
MFKYGVSQHDVKCAVRERKSTAVGDVYQAGASFDLHIRKKADSAFDSLLIGLDTDYAVGADFKKCAQGKPIRRTEVQNPSAFNE